MRAVPKRAPFTPDDLLRIPDAKSFELIDGELVERNVSVLASWVGGEISRRIVDNGDPERTGWIFGSDLGL